MQPSAQGIASLFMGNPGALAQRVDQDRKTSPVGIPDDLRQLMALNIVTTENDAAKRQQALSQLQQMAPQGQAPTVADNVRMQAQQKMQARMVQEQQKQQALQQMMGGLPAAGIPPGVPQPQRQPEPQGIDQAPVEFGMAGGGIVSFQEGGRYETPYDRMNRLNQEDAAANERRVITLPEGTSRQEAEQVQMANPDANVVVEGGGQVLRDIGSALKRGFLYSSDVEAAKQRGKQQEALSAPIARTEAIGSEVENLRRRAAAQMEERQRPVTAPSAPPVSRRPSPGIAAALPQVQQPEAETTKQPAFERSLTTQGARNLSDAAKLQERAEYESMVGRPDRTQLDRLMAEYERQKAAAEGPKAGFDALLEYLGQIAATPRGMSSFEAGAAGARGVRALEKERAAQRAALTEKQIGLEREQLKEERQYMKDLFGVGNQAYDRAFKANMDLLREEGVTERQAMQDAAAMTREKFRAEKEEQLVRLRAKLEERIRAMPTQADKFRDETIAEYMKENPGVTRIGAMQALGLTGTSAGRTATPTDRLRAAQTMLEQAGSEEERNIAMATIREILGGQTSATPLPKNATEKDLVVGTVYQTAKGPAKWTGKVFMPI